MGRPSYILKTDRISQISLVTGAGILRSQTLEDVRRCARLRPEQAGLENRCSRQSNAEQRNLIDWGARRPGEAAAGIINQSGPAFTHTSIAASRCLTLSCPVIEVHISNIHKRESFRQHSYVSARADAALPDVALEATFCFRAAYARALREGH
ncbi:UNVERIFIED_CONTAM: hypothetical protein GTU68_009310 [Idotea baltica]|nr:hypothetical protein [Idotea baltica]